MGHERKTLRVPEVESDEADDVVQALNVLLSFYPFKRPKVSWVADERSVVASFDFITMDSDRLDAMTFQFLLQYDVLPKLYGERGPLICYEDESLGFLLWDSELSYWKCEVELTPDCYVEFQLDSSARGEVSVRKTENEEVERPDPALIKRARAIAVAIKEEDARWRSAAADHLLDLYNNNWNHGASIDSAAFQGRLSASAVQLHRDGTAEVWLSQEELFTDHLVKLFVSQRGVVTDADLEG